jgi:hypothetical protein
VPSKINLVQILSILAASPLIAAWRVLIVDEAAQRAVYRIRCQLLRPSYHFEIRLIQTETEITYSYQLFTDHPLIRWDNAPHFPGLQSFPHHVHDETGLVVESPLQGDVERDLSSVLDQLGALVTRL